MPHVKLGGSVYQAFVEFTLTNVNNDEWMRNIAGLNKYFNHSTLTHHKFKEAYYFFVTHWIQPPVWILTSSYTLEPGSIIS